MIERFEFNPPNGLMDKERFPTQPQSEEEARAQFMELFNQLKDYINSVVSILNETGL